MCPVSQLPPSRCGVSRSPLGFPPGLQDIVRSPPAFRTFRCLLLHTPHHPRRIIPHRHRRSLLLPLPSSPTPRRHNGSRATTSFRHLRHPRYSVQAGCRHSPAQPLLYLSTVHGGSRAVQQQQLDGDRSETRKRTLIAMDHAGRVAGWCRSYTMCMVYNLSATSTALESAVRLPSTPEPVRDAPSRRVVSVPIFLPAEVGSERVEGQDPT